MESTKGLRERGLLSAIPLFSLSVVSSIVGIVSALLLYPQAASILGVVFLAFGQAPLVEALLDRNREQIWKEGVAARQANVQLAMGLSALFTGVFVTYFIAVLWVDTQVMELWFEWQLDRLPSASFETISFGSFDEILSRNIVVAFAALLAALIYRHGGMLLVLAWNASTWGAVFSCIVRLASADGESSPLLYTVKMLFCILPHLVTEAVAYVLIAMSGVFISRALTRYRWTSDPFNQVGRAVLNILAFATVLLIVASLIEAHWAPLAIQLTY
jgi:uncharacterized membrane protein SpoIIM required for sporulation